MVLHASAVSIKNKAYLFIGPSGAGKSFFMSKLMKNAKFISEDISFITQKDKKFLLIKATLW